MNIIQNKQSAIVSFPYEESSSEIQVHSRAIYGENHTIVAGDISRARSLQGWIRNRLSKETMSRYLVTIQELLNTSGKRDLVVQVLAVDLSTWTLNVTDGSVDSVAMDVSNPVLAAKWLAAGVKVGDWLRIQQASAGTGGITASAALVTHVPPWCLDVQMRKAQLDTQSTEDAADAADAADAPQEDLTARIEEAPSPAGARRRAKRELRDGESLGTELDERSDTPREPREKSQFHTFYVETLVPKRLSQVRPAAVRGERCFVLENFSVARISDVSGKDARDAQKLVVTRCCCCGHVFPAPSTDVRAMKRQRKLLPCGHWLFKLEFRFKLELEDGDETLLVFVTDSGEVFGESPEDLIGDQEACQRVQQSLDALVGDLGRPRAGFQHSLAVYRHDGPDTDLFGAYVVCDTKLKLLAA